jgi:hypothetical protein
MESLVKYYCKGTIDPKMTLEGTIEKYLSTYNFNGAEWRRRHTKNLSSIFEPLLNRGVNKITFTDIYKIFRKTKRQAHSLNIVLYDLVNVLKFVSDGAVRSPGIGHHVDDPVKVDESGEPTVKIKHQFMDSAEAEKLFYGSGNISRTHSKLKDSITNQLQNLPEGNAYIFSPQTNLDVKELRNLRINLSVYFRRILPEFKIRLNPGKKLFGIFRKPVTTKETKK